MCVLLGTGVGVRVGGRVAVGGTGLFVAVAVGGTGVGVAVGLLVAVGVAVSGGTDVAVERAVCVLVGV